MKIYKSIRFATKKHEGQFRKYNEEPYVIHPYRVVYKLIMLDSELVTEPMLLAAMLHDTIEDTDTTEEELRIEFGPTVARLVQEVTNPSKGSKLSRAEKKKMDRDHLAVVSTEAKFIKLADRIDNLESMYDAPEDFKILYIKESKMLLEVLRGVSVPLEAAYEKVLEELEEHLHFLNRPI